MPGIGILILQSGMYPSTLRSNASLTSSLFFFPSPCSPLLYLASISVAARSFAPLVPSRRYENEHACGKAISDWLEDHPHVTREEIFYTTKLKTNVSRLDTVDKIKKSLKTSTLSYIDLYLLHSPIGGEDVRRECWKGCVDAKEYGWVKSIGVSNYGTKHIEEFVKAKGEMPVLNQLDNHPFMRRPEIVQACEKEGILIEVSLTSRSSRHMLIPLSQAWGPLVRGQRFNHPTITSISTKHSKSPAQVLLRWSIQHVRPSPPSLPALHETDNLGPY
jgi:diketogulonate reductase-like aldo/keto reductase